MDGIILTAGVNSMEEKITFNRSDERHVHIKSKLNTNKLKKHYEPLEIQVTFNTNEDDYPCRIVENTTTTNDDTHKDSTLLTKRKHSDTSQSDDTVTDEIANLLAAIHIKDDDTIDFLKKHVQFLLCEITKRNTIIFSLLKHLDFMVNQDIQTIKNDEQLNEYLNINKGTVEINDVISSSHWNHNNENIKSIDERINDYDWQLDIFQYIKNNIDNIDSVLMPEGNKITKHTDINENKDPGNITEHGCKCTTYKDEIPSTVDLEVVPTSDDEISSADLINDESIWPQNTIAVVGDNMLHGLDEKRLGGKNWNVKCRVFPDAQVNDFFHYIKPILKKKPSHLVCHVGTNDAPYFSSRDIYDSILSLKGYIENELPSCRVIISKPIIRMDNCKANLALLKVNQHLDNLRIPTIDNGNFGLNHLNKNGPNLNPKGTARLAMNIISQLRSLQNENTSNPSTKLLNLSNLNPGAKSFSPSSSSSES